jgi:hypothetical protein
LRTSFVTDRYIVCVGDSLQPLSLLRHIAPAPCEITIARRYAGKVSPCCDLLALGRLLSIIVARDIHGNVTHTNATSLGPVHNATPAERVPI